jgi:small multidrug resistance family-3 protein
MSRAFDASRADAASRPGTGCGQHRPREAQDFGAPRTDRCGNEDGSPRTFYTIPGARKGAVSRYARIFVEKNDKLRSGPWQRKGKSVLVVKTALLFVVTALAEITGCYLPYLWLRKDGSGWLLLPAAVSLALFAYLLTLHPAASGRTYAAYGGVYVATALVWLRLVDDVRLGPLDWIGAGLSLLGMAIIASGWEAVP